MFNWVVIYLSSPPPSNITYNMLLCFLCHSQKCSTGKTEQNIHYYYRRQSTDIYLAFLYSFLTFLLIFIYAKTPCKNGCRKIVQFQHQYSDLRLKIYGIGENVALKCFLDYLARPTIGKTIHSATYISAFSHLISEIVQLLTS